MRKSDSKAEKIAKEERHIVTKFSKIKWDD